jgi:Na+:H+ antiporter, NhaB family
MTAVRRAFVQNFLGHAPGWYKLTVVVFLALNPALLWLTGPFMAGWVLLLEFIFTLAMALRCYPLQPGGLLALEGIILGLSNRSRSTGRWRPIFRFCYC